eukprot:556853-Pelagomonas_calceolata.AAC.4
MGRADFPPRAGPGMSKPELNGEKWVHIRSEAVGARHTSQEDSIKPGMPAHRGKQWAGLRIRKPQMAQTWQFKKEVAMDRCMEHHS